MNICMNRPSMRACSLGVAALACLLAAPALAGTVDYVMVPVGNPGNANDTGGSQIGAVAYSYQIGKYDVTIGQYTAFLNAVDPAGTNPHGIYNSSMGTEPSIAGISFNAGSTTGTKYAVMAVSGISPYGGVSNGNRPITYVSWFDVARFANWMTNGQGNGSTETGAYTLNNATSGNAIAANAGAAYRIPTENEWYKAAYYSPTLNGGTGGYYDNAVQSVSGLGNIIGSSSNQANFLKVNFLFGGPKFSVTQSAYSSNQNYLTDVGAFSGSGSFYGTFDQSGNVYQWNDLDGQAGLSRQVRGGGAADEYTGILSSNHLTVGPSIEQGNYGFRLAGPAAAPVPEIDPSSFGSAFALLIGSLGWMERRARRGLGLVTAT